MRVTIRQDAPADTVLAPDAYAGQVGREVDIVAPLHLVAGAHGRLLGARVAEDGRSALLTIEVTSLTGFGTEES
jgi:hypothetical protein